MSTKVAASGFLAWTGFLVWTGLEILGLVSVRRLVLLWFFGHRIENEKDERQRF
jgi:hypothetical protein